MKLQRYLKTRGGGSSLTMEERNLLGIKDCKSGWIQRYASICINDELLMKLREARAKRKPKNKFILPKINYSDFYKSEEWRNLRKITLDKYGYRCMKCSFVGSHDNPICVDHILPISVFPTRKLEPSNLQVLCYKCNKEKSNKVVYDLRPDGSILAGKRVREKRSYPAAISR